MSTRSRYIDPCAHCPLGDGIYVRSWGSVSSRVFVVGTSPGKWESEDHKPFTGPSGSLVPGVLADLGINVGNLWFTNVVRRRPLNTRGNTRKPTGDECRTCGQHLVEEMRLHSVELIMAVGQIAMEYLLGRDDLSILKMHGLTVTTNAFQLAREYQVFPVYDPGYVNRQGGLTSKVGNMWLLDIEEFAEKVKVYAPQAVSAE